jgi:hypothetical protein
MIIASSGCWAKIGVEYFIMKKKWGSYQGMLCAAKLFELQSNFVAE